MKRCPKCSRSYPDDNQKFCTFDGGLLVGSDTPYDPNATVQLPSRQIVDHPTVVNTEPIDLAATIASARVPPPDVSRPTPPIGSETVYEHAPPPPPRPTPQVAAPPRANVSPAPAARKSKMPLILGSLLLLLVLGVGAAIAVFFLVIKPRLDEERPDRPVVVTNPSSNDNANTNDNVNSSAANTTTEEEVAPPGTVRFASSNSKLDGKLAEHFFDFSFYYPNGWAKDPKAGVPGASNFVKVERRLPPDFTQENFAVGWYTSKGTFEADESTFPQLVEKLSASLAKGLPEYRKVSEGPTKVNGLDGYEFRFVGVSKGTEKGDLDLWGRVIFLPSGVSENESGATLQLFATSLAPELSGVDDVGEKGELQVILDSFRFGKRP